MKDLIIPVDNNNEVNLSEIDEEFNGLIIGYNKNKAIGHIQCDEDLWFLTKSIYTEDTGSNYADDTLIGLIKTLIKDKVCTDFKVIEFEE